MNHTALIFIGSGVGGVSRYWLSNGVYSLFGRQFPYGTLAVNATGSFLVGFLFVVLLDRFDGMDNPLRALLTVGFLGGYTTFSAFSIETIQLIARGTWSSAVLNVCLNVMLSISLAWLGVLGARQC
ncbi:MAG TPA: fluoride efflux transporter CrcB [Legionella sp.]|nr:fluoride efflux transporter CrcB [Legionella sp.]